jgi:hypothetical protein
MIKMFENFKKLGDDIYVYKNFISKEECKQVTNYLDDIPKSEWILGEGDFLNTIDYIKKLEMIQFVKDKMINFLPEKLFLGENLFTCRMNYGCSWAEHADIHNFFEIEQDSLNYIDGNPYEEKQLSVYGTIVYFNDFEGGELYYPTQNIIYKPEPGDLVIHGSSSKCMHGVKKVKSEKRYSHSNYIYKMVKVAA